MANLQMKDLQLSTKKDKITKNNVEMVFRVQTPSRSLRTLSILPVLAAS
jgi:hypothetical protein